VRHAGSCVLLSCLSLRLGAKRGRRFKERSGTCVLSPFGLQTPFVLWASLSAAAGCRLSFPAPGWGLQEEHSSQRPPATRGKRCQLVTFAAPPAEIGFLKRLLSMET
jgi:hypothetical protein